MARRIVVDKLKCESNGYCMAIANTLLIPAADGSPISAGIICRDADERAARLAISACPMNALSITDRDDEI